jgi:hypothetical protein
MISGGFRRSLLVAKVRIVRQYRSTLDQPWIAFLQVFAVFFGAVLVVGRLPISGYGAVWDQPGAYAFGRQLATGGASVLPTARGFAGVAFVLLVFLTVLKEATDGAIDTNADAALLATGPRTVAAGEILWSTLFAGWQFGVPLLAGAVAFGVGADSVLAGVGMAVASALLVATAVPLGYVAALSLRLAFQKLPALRENKAVLGAPLAVVYFALFLRARQSIATLSGIPVGWFGDLGLLAASTDADPAHAALALVGAPVTIAAATLLAGRLGEASWYGDRPREEDAVGGEVPARLVWALEFVAEGPPSAVARTVWIRLLREPRVLLFAALPVALTATLGLEVVGRRPAALPMVVAVYLSAAVGMGATLNPLGNLGAGLPAVLTTPAGGRAVVDGYVLSAAVPGVPLVVGLSVLTGVGVGLTPVTVLAAGLTGAVLTVGASVVAQWIGVALPNYDSLRATSGSGVRPPRLWATTVFLLAVVVLGMPALVGIGWGTVIATGTGVTTATVVLGSTAASLVATASVSALAYRRTLSAIENYRID